MGRRMKLAVVLAGTAAFFVPGRAALGAGLRDSKAVEEGLQSEDKALWYATARELAELRAGPLDQTWPESGHGGRVFRIHVMPLLNKHLFSEDPERRIAAAEAIVGLLDEGQVDGWFTFPTKRSVGPSQGMIEFSNDPEPRVRAAMFRIWRHRGRRSAAALAVKLLADPSPRVRAQAIVVLITFGLSGEIIDIINGYRRKEFTERLKAPRSDAPPPDMEEAHGPPAPLTYDMIIDRICAKLDDKDTLVRLAAMKAVLSFQAERAVSDIAGCLDDEDPAVRHGAAMVMGWLRIVSAADRLDRLLDENAEGRARFSTVRVPGELASRAPGRMPRTTVAEAAMWALGELGDSRAVHRLHEALRVKAEGKWKSNEHMSWLEYPKDWHARTAAYALGKIGHPASLAELREARGRPDVGLAAGQSLALMGLVPYERGDERPPVDAESVRSLRRSVDDRGRLNISPVEFIPRLHKAVDVDEFVRQIIRPRADLPKDGPLSLIADFPSVRTGAIRYLGRLIHDPGLRDAFLKAASEDDPALRWGGIYFLARARDDLAAQLAREAEVPKERNARFFTGLAIAEIGDPRGAELLREFMDDPSSHLRFIAASVLIRYDDPRAVLLLATMAEDGPPELQSEAAYALCAEGGASAAHVLESWVYRKSRARWALYGLSRLAREGKISRKRLVQAVKSLGAEPMICAENALTEFRAELLAQLEETAYDEVSARPWALAAIGNRGVIRRCLELLKHERAAVRVEALKALAELGPPDILDPLLNAISDRVLGVRIAATRALGYWAFRQGNAVKQAALAVLREFDETWNLRLQLESLAARARIGDASVKLRLMNIIEEGPEWRRIIARAGLAVLGETEHLGILQKELLEELEHTHIRGRPKPYEVIRLLGWCGDVSSLDLLKQIAVHPLTDPETYDGGRQRRSLHAACAYATWRINRQK